MTNSYNVNDRVELYFKRKCVHNGQPIEFDDPYAGTIITYRLLTDKTTGEPYYLYKVSVDGIGDIVFAKEVETGKLKIVQDYSEDME